MKYESPKILKETEISLERELLAGSVVDTEKTGVESVGQEVVTIDASSFTSEWE